MLEITLFYCPNSDYGLHDTWDGFDEADRHRKRKTYAQSKGEFMQEGGTWHIQAETCREAERDYMFSKEELIGRLKFYGGGTDIIKSLLYVAPNSSDHTVSIAIKEIAVAFYRLGLEHGKSNHVGERTIVESD